MTAGEEENEQWGRPHHPNAGYDYHPILENLYIRRGHRITLSKVVF